MLTEKGANIFAEQVLNLFDNGHIFSEGELEDIRWNFLLGNEVSPLPGDSIFSPHIKSILQIKDRTFELYWIARYPDIEIYDHQLEEIN